MKRNDLGFGKAYRTAVEEVIAAMPEDWSMIARHNVGWRKSNFDARQYLLDSEVRFLRTFKAFNTAGVTNLLDVGGFLAAFPLAMSRLGYFVSIAEKFDYYSGALDGIARLLVDNGIEVIDSDFTLPDEIPKGCYSRFDAVSCMAVVEHLAHSPNSLMENISNVLVDKGTFVFETPNLAYWPRRFSLFFRGRTVLAPIDQVYHSAVPFTGHHREYTLADVRYVLGQGGFEIVREERFNYGMAGLGLKMALFMMPARLFSSCAGVIFIHSRKK